MVNNLIDEQLKKVSEYPVKIMMHMVAGFPNIETNLQVANIFQKHKIDFLEVQMPFSHPMADGNTITQANVEALKNGMNLEKYFQLLQKLKENINIPLIAMTYFNIPFKFGLTNFCQEISSIGLSGIIIPDILFDNKQENYLEITKKHNLHPILVLSPGIKEERLSKLSKEISGFAYTTLKVGITGTQDIINTSGFKILNRLKEKTTLPIAAGFGISKSKHIQELIGKTDIVVIGSHIINLTKDKKIKDIENFLVTIKKFS